MSALTILERQACQRSGCACQTAVRRGAGKTHCVLHADPSPSMNVQDKDGTLLVRCHAGCDQAELVGKLKELALWPESVSRNGATTARISVSDLALDKGLPVAFLRSLGLEDSPRGVTIPYRNQDGTVAHLKRRTALIAKEGSRWPAGQPLMAYGLERLSVAREQGYLILVEGESDGWTAWQHDLPCLGIPGADAARVLKAEHLDGIDRVFVLREPDQGGEHFVEGTRAQLTHVGWQGELLVFTCGAYKDLNALHLSDPQHFCDLLLGRLEDPQPTANSVSAGPATTPAETLFTWHTAYEIGHMVMPLTTWRAKGLLADGTITELDGKVKRAGKTTFILAMCAAILGGTDFLGEATRASPIVYLTEQAPRTFREALRRAGLLERQDLHVLYWHDTRGVDWPLVVAAAAAKAVEAGAHVLIIDTLSQFVGLRGDAENASGDALQAVQPLQAAVAGAHDLALLFSRHERKSGGDVGDSGRGSSAYAGAVDIVLSLRRPDGAVRPTLRLLQALSRFDETPDSLVIELVDQHYIALGDESVLAVSAARARILDTVPTSPDQAKPGDNILAVAEVGRTLGRGILAGLVNEEVLVRSGAGKRGDPYCFYRPADGVEKLSAALKDEVRTERNWEGDAA